MNAVYNSIYRTRIYLYKLENFKKKQLVSWL